MKKKITTLFICLTLLLTFTSCKQQANTTSKEGDAVTLSWYCPGPPQNDLQIVLDKVNEKIAEKIGAKIDLQFVENGAFTEKMQMNMASGKGMDLLFTGWVNPFNTGTKNGSYADLTDLLPMYAPELWKETPEYVWGFAKVKGKIYAVPNQQIFALQPGLEIDEKLVEKYKERFNFNGLTKMEDLEPFLKLIKENEPDLIPYRLNHISTMWIYGKVEEVAADVYMRTDNEERKAKPFYEIDEIVQSYKTLTDWFKKGYIRADIDSSGNDEAEYKAGKFAVSTNLWKPGFETMVKNQTGRNVKFITWHKPSMLKSGGSRAMTAVSSNSKNIQKCVEFLNLVNTDKDIFNLFAFGLKDVHYKINSNNKVEYVPNSNYAPMADWTFGSQFNAMVVEGQNNSIWNDMENINDSAVKSPLIGFVFDPSKVKVEMSNLAASVKINVVRYNEEKLAEYKDKQKQFGYDRVLSEAQKQLDEFFSK